MRQKKTCTVSWVISFDMYFQSISSIETIFTFVTLVRLFIGVNDFMSLQSGHLLEPFWTRFALVWSLSSVNSDMNFQIINFVKNLSTSLAFKWITWVNQFMHFQISDSFEPNKTSCTLKWSGACMVFFMRFHMWRLNETFVTNFAFVL